MTLSTCEEHSDGTLFWELPNGDFHRLDGPAVIYLSGTKEWWEYGKRHRLDGPAVIKADGTQEWWQHNDLHRENGPAVIEADGSTYWALHDYWHRVDGPASDNADEEFTAWYIHGRLVDLEEKRVGLFCEARDMDVGHVDYEKFSLYSQDYEPDGTFVATFLHLKDHVNIDMLDCENSTVAAIAAWHLPVNDDYMAVALKSSTVRDIMQCRTDVPEHLQTLLQVTV